MAKDWLTEVFEYARKAYAELPEWARPVYTPSSIRLSGSDAKN